jgi:hypothetical protein
MNRVFSLNQQGVFTMFNDADVQNLLKDAAEHPQDGNPKLVLADRLIELGYPTLGAIWQWLGHTRRHPRTFFGGLFGFRSEWCRFEIGPQHTIPSRMAEHCHHNLYVQLRDKAEANMAVGGLNLFESVAALAPGWAKIRKAGFFRKAWVPDAEPVRWLTDEECRLMKLTGGVR